MERGNFLQYICKDIKVQNKLRFEHHCRGEPRHWPGLLSSPIGKLGGVAANATTVKALLSTAAATFRIPIEKFPWLAAYALGHLLLVGKLAQAPEKPWVRH